MKSMSGRPRIAVLGLYSSGSTAIAGMLHRLGVNLGAPFWRSTGDASSVNFYEPYDLNWHLRRWWDEPKLKRCVTREYRVEVLAAWAMLQAAISPKPIGAKHPLLSLCGGDLLDAWGAETQFVWAWRPLTDSIASLQRRGWFAGYETSVQEQLWNALSEFEESRVQLVRFEWDRVREDPVGVAHQLASLAGIEPSEKQIVTAASFIRRD